MTRAEYDNLPALLTVTQVCRVCNLTKSQVRYLFDTGNLSGKRFGRDRKIFKVALVNELGFQIDEASTGETGSKK